VEETTSSKDQKPYRDQAPEAAQIELYIRSAEESEEGASDEALAEKVKIELDAHKTRDLHKSFADLARFVLANREFIEAEMQRVDKLEATVSGFRPQTARNIRELHRKEEKRILELRRGHRITTYERR